MRLLINLVPRILMYTQGLYQWNMGLMAMMREYGSQPSTKQSHPRLLMSVERHTYLEFDLTQSSMVWRPWWSKKVSIMSANSKVTLALFKASMMALIKLWSWSTHPRSVHLVRCFEVLSSHPHCRHSLMMFSSQSETFQLQLHQPDTYFVMNVQKVFGYLEIARLYPSHQTESKWADEMIPFS